MLWNGVLKLLNSNIWQNFLLDRKIILTWLKRCEHFTFWRLQVALEGDVKLEAVQRAQAHVMSVGYFWTLWKTHFSSLYPDHSTVFWHSKCKNMLTMKAELLKIHCPLGFFALLQSLPSLFGTNLGTLLWNDCLNWGFLKYMWSLVAAVGCTQWWSCTILKSSGYFTSCKNICQLSYKEWEGWIKTTHEAIKQRDKM